MSEKMSKVLYNHQLTTLEQLIKSLQGVSAEAKKAGATRAQVQLFLTETPQGGGTESAIEIIWKPEAK